MIKTKIVRP